jgi:nucleoid DNA-binding protein
MGKEDRILIVPASRTPVFKAGKALKDAVSK